MKYGVVFERFAETHFIQKFVRKYKGAWERTCEGLLLEFTLVDLLFEKNIAETVSVSRDGAVRICKTEFRVAGTDASRHASGNRCIIAVHSEPKMVRVLLAYSKTDLSGTNETAKWKAIVKKNYPEYKNLV